MNAALSMEAHAEPLTAEELTKLKAELTEDPTARGYKDKTSVQILWLIGEQYIEDNKEKQGTIPIKEWNRDELYNVLLQASTADGIPVLIAIEKLVGSDNPQIAVLAKQAMLTINAPLKAINLENAKVAQGFGALAQLGVLTPEVYAYITSKPDPDWSPKTEPKRRLWELFGEGAVVSKADIERAM